MERKPLKRTGMARAKRGYWTCQRKRGGAKCGHVNPNRKRKCEMCEGAKRPKSKPKHMAVLTTMSYEEFVEITGGETCGICNAKPKARRLHRDHDHETGKARGLLCMRCNTALRQYMTISWLRSAAAYLERAER